MAAAPPTQEAITTIAMMVFRPKVLAEVLASSESALWVGASTVTSAVATEMVRDAAGVVEDAALLDWGMRLREALGVVVVGAALVVEGGGVVVVVVVVVVVDDTAEDVAGVVVVVVVVVETACREDFLEARQKQETSRPNIVGSKTAGLTVVETGAEVVVATVVLPDGPVLPVSLPVSFPVSCPPRLFPKGNWRTLTIRFLL